MSLWWCHTHDAGFFLWNCFCKIFWGWVSELNTGLKKRRRASSQIRSPDGSSQDCEKHDTLLREEKSQWWWSAKLSVGVFGLFLYTPSAPPCAADLFWWLCTVFYYILKQFLPKEEEHSHCQNLKCNTDLHASPELPSIHCCCNHKMDLLPSCIPAQRHAVPPLYLHKRFIPILQISIYPCTRGWYCLTKTVEEKIAPLLPSFLQHPPRIPEICKEKFRFIKRKRRGCRWFWRKELQRENTTPAAREGGKEAERYWPIRVFFSNLLPHSTKPTNNGWTGRRRQDGEDFRSSRDQPPSESDIKHCKDQGPLLAKYPKLMILSLKVLSLCLSVSRARQSRVCGFFTYL